MQKAIKKKKVKAITPRRIFLLIILIATNTFAWFIYATKIRGEISGHVRAWNIVFESGDTQLSDVVNISVADLYPGMPNFGYNISIYNHSEVSASVTYTILEARILDDEYVTTEGRGEREEQVQPDDPTSSELQTLLATEYPFTISLSVTNNQLVQNNGQETFGLSVTWPYESNQDDVDTQWGIAAYDFKEDNPTLESIHLKVKIYVIQNSTQNDNQGQS